MDDLDFHSLFSVGQPIENPKYFAGRKSDIERATKSLCSPGASIMIYGERGVGKSSFAQMLKLIVNGEYHLLYKHGLQKNYPVDKLKYRVISCDCDAETTTTSKVLQRLVTSPTGIKSLISSRIDRVESVIKDKYVVDLFKLISLGTESSNTITRQEFKEESIFELFTNLILHISRSILLPGEGLLICIDEFDLVDDSHKMASLIKNYSKGNVKFMISGIGDSYEQLLTGHSSVARQFTFGRIKISPMNFNEVADLFALVESNTERKVRFDDGFIKGVFTKSGGYPYYVQLFGQLAVDNCRETTGLPLTVHNRHLTDGLRKLRSMEYQMDDEYLSIIKENPSKELVIKLMAKTTSRKISDDDIHKECYKYGLTPPQPKNLIASLLGQRNPKFIFREVDDSEFFSFVNPLFKVYVNSRETELIKIVNGDFVLN